MCELRLSLCDRSATLDIPAASPSPDMETVHFLVAKDPQVRFPALHVWTVLVSLLLSLRLWTLPPWFLPLTCLLCISRPCCPLLFARQAGVKEQDTALLFYEDVRLLCGSGGFFLFFCVRQSPLAQETVPMIHLFKIKYTYVLHNSFQYLLMECILLAVHILI